MNSESVKPLLSAEEMLNAAHSLFDRYKTKVLIDGGYFPVMDRICFISAMKEYASQLQPSSPQLEQEVKRLQEENERLKTVMIAAAEEIKQHWEAHCDHEGYGPSNLLRRLENGIPAQYGYTAGAFASMDARIKELEQQLSQSDAAGLLDDLISEALLCGYLNGRKQVEERVSVSGYGNRFRDQVEIKKMTTKLLAALPPDPFQSPTLEEGQKDPEQQ